MSLFHAVVLAVVQGLTEFLPVSSSAHLILIPWLLHWPDGGMAFDVALHAGTLFAVILIFSGHVGVPHAERIGNPVSGCRH